MSEAQHSKKLRVKLAETAFCMQRLTLEEIPQIRGKWLSPGKGTRWLGSRLGQSLTFTVGCFFVYFEFHE